VDSAPAPPHGLRIQPGGGRSTPQQQDQPKRGLPWPEGWQLGPQAWRPAHERDQREEHRECEQDDRGHSQPEQFAGGADAAEGQPVPAPSPAPHWPAISQALPAAGEQVPHPEDQEVGRGLQQVLPPRLEPQASDNENTVTTWYQKYSLKYNLCSVYISYINRTTNQKKIETNNEMNQTLTLCL